MELIFPTIEHKQAALEYRKEHFDCGETEIHGDGGLDNAKTYKRWLKKLQDDVTRSLTEEFVPATTYFAMLDGKIVGTIQIRHRLNERLLNSYGHIGYGVRPSERRKGYATQMLALALEKCRALGIERALVSCDINNIGSAKTILKNGGILFNEYIEDDGDITQQYWIDL